MTLRAKGKINLDETDAISVASKADVDIKGNNINVKANIGAVVKGNASAEFSASGNTT